MKLTPLEIRKQEFRKSLRGLDPIEVQTFLDMVSEQYEALLEENKSSSRRLIELEAKLHNYQESEKTLRETLLNVQEVKKQTEESNRRQSDLIKKEAELKALEIVESARNESRKIREEINWLKSQKESFINRIRHVLVSQIELLSVMEIDDVLPDDAKQSVEAWNMRKNVRKHISEQTPVDLPPLMDDTDEDHKKKDVENDLTDAADAPEQPEDSVQDTRVIQQFNEPEPDEAKEKNHKKKSKDDPSLTEDDINDFFKKGLQIDDLIKTINKKDFDK